MHQPCASAVWSTGVGTRARSQLQLKSCAWHLAALHTKSGCPELPLEEAALSLKMFSRPNKHMNFPFLPELEIVPLWMLVPSERIAIGHCDNVQPQGGNVGSHIHRGSDRHRDFEPWLASTSFVEFPLDLCHGKGVAAQAPTAVEVSGLSTFCRRKCSQSCCNHLHICLPSLIITKIFNKKQF